MSKEDDGVSTTTGATDKTRILALTDKQLARVMNGLVAAYSPADGEWHDDLAALAFTTCLDAMRGKVIASAADVANVPTAEELAAMKHAADAAHLLGQEATDRGNHGAAERWHRQGDVVRAYLERVTG